MNLRRASSFCLHCSSKPEFPPPSITSISRAYSSIKGSLGMIPSFLDCSEVEFEAGKKEGGVGARGGRCEMTATS